jgi:hypothetical protein
MKLYNLGDQVLLKNRGEGNIWVKKRWERHLLVMGLGLGGVRGLYMSWKGQVEGEEVAKPPGLVTKWFGGDGEQWKWYLGAGLTF